MFVNSIRRTIPIKQQQQRMFMSWMNSKLHSPSTATSTTTATAEEQVVQDEPQTKKLTDKEKIELVYRLYNKNHIPLAQSELRPWGAPYTDTAELEALDLEVKKTPVDMVDKLADGIMKTLRVLVHAFFRDRYDIHHSLYISQ